ncbi:hypothetical protein MO867_18785 [Microbulbifer sp. OS29]|uniref:Uncharacterized protein n=1 Tax=Microbulbifer okhotskensis TaxID=2926617 RepID=A0A9X2EUY4_9GAMM|nr:hypothetical protein [Microbulbifer okhotskensis]MCO1336383.1 hypothetical protein [Microbulbifer okhotskensis]
MSDSFKDMTVAICAVLLCTGILTVQSKEPKLSQQLAANIQSISDVITTSGMVRSILPQKNQRKSLYWRIPAWGACQSTGEI